MSGERSAHEGNAPRNKSASRRHLLPAAFGWALIAYAAALFVGLWGYAALRIQSDYRSTRNETRDDLRNVAAAIEAQVEAMLNDGVGAALAAVNEVGPGGIRTANDAQLSQTLANMLTGGAYVRSLFIAAPDRLVLVHREGPMSGAAELPAWMQPMFSAPTGDTWVGPPLADPTRKGALVIPIARRAARGTGQETWAGAMFAFRMLDDLYSRFAPRTGGIALVSDDGTLLMRATNVDMRAVEGTTVSRAEVFRQIGRGADSAVLDGLGPYTGKMTTFAYDRVDGYPLFAVTARQHESTFAEWQARRREILTLTAILSALLAAMTWLLHRAVRLLRRREMDYRTLFNNAAFSAFVMEGERIVDANDTARAMFGVPPGQELIGRAPWEFSPERQPDGRLSEVRVRETLGRALSGGAATFEWTHKRLDTGEPFACEVEISVLHAGSRTLTLAVVHDVSRRKLEQSRREQAMAELRELAGTLVRLQDEERRRIGRDLHDTTGQNLAALEMKLGRIANAEQIGPAQRASIADCVELASLCSAEIRTASYLMHPPLLDEIGLVSALRWLADGLRRRSDIETRLELPETMDRLPRDHELAIFRVAQEALTNVHRHSGSRSAVIRLFDTGDTVVLEVEDAGQGMPEPTGNAEDAGGTLGVGLAGMRERMRQLGGTLTVRSGSEGTCVRAEISAVHAPPVGELAAP
jgi:PAS domain S-box-containing protein